MMAAECPLPADVYTEALESHLLLTSLANLYGQLRGGPLPPHLSMHSRNDLIQDARMLLDGPSFYCFMQYSRALELRASLLSGTCSCRAYFSSGQCTQSCRDTCHADSGEWAVLHVGVGQTSGKPAELRKASA